MLGNKEELQTLCRGLGALDAIMCEEWEYRYYSYINDWDINEECFEMRNGEGNHFLILFTNKECVISGYELGESTIKFNENDIPSEFSKFLFGEPIKTIGTTFCMWTQNGEWIENTYGKVNLEDDMVSNLYGDTVTKYSDWAYESYEPENYLSPKIVEAILNGEKISESMILELNPSRTISAELKDELSYSLESLK